MSAKENATQRPRSQRQRLSHRLAQESTLFALLHLSEMVVVWKVQFVPPHLFAMVVLAKALFVFLLLFAVAAGVVHPARIAVLPQEQRCDRNDLPQADQALRWPVPALRCVLEVQARRRGIRETSE